MTGRLKTPDGTWTLLPLQALALYEVYHQKTDGLNIMIPVGGGKTLVSLLLPVVARESRAVLILPAGLIGKTKLERVQLAKQFRVSRTLQMQSYEMMGRVQAASFLGRHRFKLIITDESHKIKNAKAACTRRFARYMAEEPDTKFVAMSGTFLKNSLDDFGHLTIWGLKERAPVPLDKVERSVWAEAMREEQNFLKPVSPGAILRLPPSPRETGEEDERDVARLRFQHRLTSTHGIICGKSEALGASLTIRGHVIQPSSVTVKNFKTLRDDWQTPDGWTLSQAIRVWAHAQELALGFHSVWWNTEDFRQCLIEETQRKNTIENTEKKILIDYASTIENGMPWAEVVETRKKLKIIEGHIISKAGTGLLKKSTKNFIQLAARFAKSVKIGAFQGAQNDLPLITTIQQAGLGAFCARVATEPSEILAILSIIFYEWSNILERANKAARPPEDWLEARKVWAKFVRETISHSRHLDSEQAVAIAASKGEIRSQEWRAWNEIRPTFRANPVMSWHDDTALEFCRQWAQDNSEGGGIIWTGHVFFARELSRRLKCPYYGREGLNADGEYIESAKKGSVVIASIAANSAGRNLQHQWNRNLITVIPGGAIPFEQLLGRTHRTGQPEDEVSADLMFSCAESFTSWDSARTEAKGVDQMVDQQHKILYSDVLVPDYEGNGPVWDKTRDTKKLNLWED